MLNTSKDFLLAEALLEGIVVLSNDHGILWCNQSAQQMLQLNADDVSSKHLTDIVTDHHLKQLLHSNETDHVEIDAPGDQDRRLSLKIRDYIQGQFLLVIQDVTHTYHLEAIRQDFVANVSHELRTPLTVFHGYLDLLLNQKAIDNDKLNQILLQMSGQAQRMERLVEDLLLLARLESVEPDISKQHLVAVAPMLRSVIADAQTLSGGRHEFIVEINDSLDLLGHADELRSVFSNIIFNAVRYTLEGGHIEISWFLQNDQPIFQVKDNGIGIEAKHLPRITQRFYRVDKSRMYRGQGGTGLGLAIVKHVLLRHQASLDISSELGQGSVFTCSFCNNIDVPQNTP